MRKIRSKDTRAELLLRKQIWRKGYHYRISPKKFPGKPDLLFLARKVVVFVDGEFWHGFNWTERKKRIRANRDYWIPKIEKNIARDSKNNKYYADEGFAVVRFWSGEVLSNLDLCVEKVCAILRSR